MLCLARLAAMELRSCIQRLDDAEEIRNGLRILPASPIASDALRTELVMKTLPYKYLEILSDGFQ